MIMKATGIVAEYNPFHNGHAYQISEVKRHMKPDVVIAVMSGNYLQRGEPALVDKWTRTQMALKGGVDLVIELPVLFSTQPADYFALGAINIFKKLNVDSLSFGIETGDASDFLEAARWMHQNETKITKEIQKIAQHKIPYAQQMEQILTSLNPTFPLDMSTPNNQLGLAYTKELVKENLDKKIKLFPVKRKAAGYHEQEFKQDTNIASATAIRKAIFNKEDVTSYIPIEAVEFLVQNKNQVVNWENYFSLLKYQITVLSTQELRMIYEMNEGIENRLKKYIYSANSFSEYIEKIKTKRYTQTRLQRLLVYVLLQITKKDVKEMFLGQTNVRVLGFTESGQKYLSQYKKKLGSSLITNINQNTKKLVKKDIIAGEIYQLGHKEIKRQDFMQMPIINIDTT